MKITRNDQRVYKEFAKLAEGEVFIEDVDGTEYVQMKLHPYDFDGETFNAVSLVTGEIYAIDPYTRVKVVNAELIISNIEKA